MTRVLRSRLVRFVGFVLMLVAIVAHAQSASAYLKLGIDVGDRFVLLKWEGAPVRYVVSDHGIEGISPAQFEAAVTRAFDSWEEVPTSTISYEFAGFTSALPGEEDGLSTLGFLFMPEMSNVLASTSFLVDAMTGELLESDIFFNTLFDWSVAPNGDASRYDVETIALHEIGHFNGLGHSALGVTERIAGGLRVQAAESVMFPVAFRPGGISNRTLRADDVAGLSDLYPTELDDDERGSISGRVLKDGRGVFGAHVVAFSPGTGALIGTFSLDDSGQFAVAGLQPGSYILRIEPLDDVDVDSFFDPDAADVDFRAAFHNRFVVVPRGGDSGIVTVAVVPK